MISTKGRYALRVMLDLAEHDTGDFIPLKTVAERQEISKKYLEIIMKDLVDKGLVHGESGKGGGYKLSRKPESYTAGEIIEAAEGPLVPVDCLASDAMACPRAKQCKTL
ncbi:MAG: Rrf2 family transcriptional regulator, partial [Clostridia bacterium]|nr:Rrf2 family transcriptional regulator [Clostridia bacterium]